MSDTTLPRSAIVFRALICLALVGSGVGVAGALVATKPDAGRNAEAAPPPRIGVIELAPLQIDRFVRGYGTVRALDSADVPARVAAVVETVHPRFAPGERVAKGETLVTLDARDFLQQVALAEEAIRAIDAQKALLDTQERALSQSAELSRSEREIAAADLARVERAAAGEAAQPREVDRARQALLAATRATVLAEEALAQIPPRRQSLVAQRAGESARLELARLSAERCTITAPIDGVLQLADIEMGESVAPGSLVARIVGSTHLELPLRIPASSRALAPVGARVELTIRGGAQPFVGTVARVAPEDDPASRTATVYVEITQGAETQSPLAPGVFAEARITPGGTAPRFAVPRRSIRDEQIAVVESGRVRLRRVTVDFHYSGSPGGAPIADSDWAVLDDTFAPGTLIVLDGSRSLVDGQPIEPVRATAAAATPEASSSSSAPAAASDGSKDAG